MPDELGTQISGLPAALSLVSKLTGDEVIGCDIPGVLDRFGNPTTANFTLNDLVNYIQAKLTGGTALNLPDGAAAGTYVPLLTMDGTTETTRYLNINNFLTKSDGMEPIGEGTASTPTPTPEPTSFDSKLTFALRMNSAVVAGVSGQVAEVSNVISVSFNAIASPMGTPVSADVMKDGVQFLALTFPTDYLDMPLSIVDPDGMAHTITFSATPPDLATV
jgi:hypothetical protein